MTYNKPIYCRFCNNQLTHTFVDLGLTPLSNSYLTQEALQNQEPSYPLHAKVCDKCLLVQVDEVVPPEEIFSHYIYFSSFSSTWLEHASKYVKNSISRFKLNSKSKVIEVASNDGYLLQNFVKAGIPCLGIEPANNVAQVAIKAGVPTEIDFFGRETAKKLKQAGNTADLMIANNVLAHVPDLNDFVAGFKIILKPQGVVTIEFPHLLNLINQIQFDTIYHEHFSYFTLHTLERVFGAHGLRIFDVEELPTHGGSLRIYVCHNESSRQNISKNLEKIKNDEALLKLDKLEGYTDFAAKVHQTCKSFTEFINQESAKGKTIAAYGAAAKGNTLLNVCNIKNNIITFVVDKNTAKQGFYLPGSHIPIFPPEKVFEKKPDYLLILPWNIAAEVREQMSEIQTWGGKFVTAIPSIKVFD